MTPNIRNDFESFLSETATTAPAAMGESVLGAIHRDLNPGAWSVFARLSIIHLFMALSTLAICPQFGIGFLREGSMGLMHYFMAFGNLGCGAACGLFFMGSTTATAGVLLRPEELRVLRGSSSLQLAALSLLSLGGFIMLGSELILGGYLLAWLLGSLAGARVILEALFAFRVRRMQLA